MALPIIPDGIVNRLLAVACEKDVIVTAARRMCRQFGRGCFVVAFASDADLASCTPLSGKMLVGAIARGDKTRVWHGTFAYINLGFGDLMESHTLVAEAVKSYDANTTAVLAVLASHTLLSPCMASRVFTLIGDKAIKGIREKLETESLSVKSMKSRMFALTEECEQSDARAQETLDALLTSQLSNSIERERASWSDADMLASMFVPEELPDAAPSEARPMLQEMRIELLASAERYLQDTQASQPPGNNASNERLVGAFLLRMMGGRDLLHELHAAFGSKAAYADALRTCASARRFMDTVKDGCHMSSRITQNWQTTVETLRAVCQVCGGKGTKSCTGCRKVSYCSRECQLKDWKRHKVECREGAGETQSDKLSQSQARPPPSPNLPSASSLPFGTAEASKTAAFCQVCRGKGTKSCTSCRRVYYCGRECQVMDWKTHKPECRMVIDKTQAALLPGQLAQSQASLSPSPNVPSASSLPAGSSEASGAAALMQRLKVATQADEAWAERHGIACRPVPANCCTGMDHIMWHIDQNLSGGCPESAMYVKRSMAFMTQKPDQSHTLPLDSPELHPRLACFLKAFRDGAARMQSSRDAAQQEKAAQKCDVG